MKRVIMLMTTVTTVTYAATNGVSVVCNALEPLATILDWEMPITITVSNGTKNAIPFIRNENVAYKLQIWIDLGNKDQNVHPPRFGLTAEKPWSAAFDLSKWEAESRLNPGESASWKLDVTHVIDILDYASARGTSNITARVQLGHNQWASSETQPFHVIPRFLWHAVDAEYWAQYKVAEFEAFDEYRNKTVKAPFFVIPIKGKRILFDYNSREVCEVPEGDMPDIQRTADEGTFSVSLPKSGRKILHNPEKAKNLIMPPPKGD